MKGQNDSQDSSLSRWVDGVSVPDGRNTGARAEKQWGEDDGGLKLMMEAEL